MCVVLQLWNLEVWCMPACGQTIRTLFLPMEMLLMERQMWFELELDVINRQELDKNGLDNSCQFLLKCPLSCWLNKIQCVCVCGYMHACECILQSKGERDKGGVARVSAAQSSFLKVLGTQLEGRLTPYSLLHRDLSVELSCADQLTYHHLGRLPYLT